MDGSAVPPLLSLQEKVLSRTFAQATRHISRRESTESRGEGEKKQTKHTFLKREGRGGRVGGGSGCCRSCPSLWVENFVCYLRVVNAAD